MNALIEKIKSNIIDQLNLVDVDPAEIEVDEPLFGDGFGLDSIDALELAVMLERSYGIKISDSSKMQEVFYSVGTLANYISEHEPKLDLHQ